MAMSRIAELESGRILIDGQDISAHDIMELRSKITVIEQDPTLFTGTLRFNLDPFNQYSAAALEELLIKAGLSDLLNREPEADSSDKGNEKSSKKRAESEITSQHIADADERGRAKEGRGIYTKIAEGGSNLSAGERQLICICRAILLKNKVVVLDEATANIDIATEEKIQRLIEHEFADSTVITIAHRLNTIIKSDRVLVLAYGKVKEYDAPRALMNDPESEFSKLLQELEEEEKQLQ
mmetsp:Transcript_10702/g.13321  ORF Transcript_10702/g.13321 Transcript_10702/m.13321 type:complete len:239 (-) Transcript_10702:35-751(-)